MACFSAQLNNWHVQKIEEIYRERLKLLIEEAGSQAKFSALTGKSPAQISQWVNASKDSKTGKPRTLDRNTARILEAKCGKPEGWMDQPLTHAVTEALAGYGMGPILAWEHPDDLPPGDFVMIPRLDVHLSAGNGRDQVEIELVKDMPQAFRTEWIRLMGLKPAKLAAMRAAGESMEPTIYDGDSLLVDTAQTTVADDKVYALWYDGGERVKRLFRLPGGGLRIVSDNPRHDTIEVAPGDLEHVRIIGRVVHRSSTGGL